MSRESLVFILGIVVFVSPFLGVTTETKRIILVAVGVLLIYVGYKLRRAAYFQSIELATGERKSEMFVENQNPEISESENSQHERV